MVQAIDVLLYIGLLTNERIMNNFKIPEPTRVNVGYCNYTTTHVITNKDIYNVNDICEQILLDQINNDEDK